ncbi:hypothetical protein DNK06_20480 [Pseudomonas daroniae]|uniref:Uncharacterized protein n=1 Tax=Phytopseudomonas daroniae TaxID=2487519 RepID=A0A4Q9QIB2_9GAMM|nr:hypothetical protein DNK06_20480 [Pseudomonas daroniae]TBU79578.1 hypothetical protein DNK31_19310 [Pseudomonas sp. FRB 228]TBU88271.1 hypothetical protein DNJ99_19955 [Pseudomonas daroniae]
MVGFPGGLVSYLAPLPLPTGQPAQDYAHAVGEVNDTYLDFGVGLPNVFAWQFQLGGPFTIWIMSVVLSPLLMLVGTPLLGGGLTVAIELAVGIFELGITIGSGAAFLGFLLLLSAWWTHHIKYKKVIPTRFNRQRREVCFVPEGHSKPIFVPWESLSAWVIQAQGATQYGIQRQYAMGVGFHHADSGQDFSLEFPCAGLPLAIANWEAIRAYMEHEVHSLKEIQDPLDLQGPDDPPHEGLHTFRNARERMRRRYREGEVGGFYVFGWYLYHVMTLWTLPFHLTEWEIGRVKRMHRQDIPEAMREWSQPLPHEQWAKPSTELLRQRELLANLRQHNPQSSIFDLMTEVGRTTVTDRKQAGAASR